MTLEKDWEAKSWAAKPETIGFSFAQRVAVGPRCLATSRDDHASHSENGNPAAISDQLGIRNTIDLGCAAHDFASQSFSKVITGDIQH